MNRMVQINLLKSLAFVSLPYLCGAFNLKDKTEPGYAMITYAVMDREFVRLATNRSGDRNAEKASSGKAMETKNADESATV